MQDSILYRTVWVFTRDVGRRIGLGVSFRLLFDKNQALTDLSIIKDINGQCGITL